MFDLNSIMLAAGGLFAIAAAALAWSFHRGVARRLDHDAAWLDEARAPFVDGECQHSRRYVIIAYIVQCAVLLPLLLFIMPSMVIGVLLWAVLWFAPQIIADQYWKKRLRQIDEQLPQSVQKFANLCSAGLSSADAMRQLAKELPNPIRREYAMMAQGWDMGAGLAGVVESAANRLQLESFQLFYVAVVTNSSLGGNLVKALSEIAQSLNGQMEMKREVDAAMAEGKMNIYGLLAAPPIMLIIIAFIDADAVRMMFHSGIGLGFFTGAVVLIAIGSIWAWQTAKIEV
ncbi:hypothetical protein FACS1894139_08150 [Planctomycetales bacterium]|nr:hypothetical protein FACS1894107_00110 [Planctomycetales bacterium]GHS96294.1 hypothetical protein FACS1894108_00670 [Planctomycetales bacterium]GHT05022.1 hypothetical protein FACS1894139_08150 [Planctomycetales bacterium]